MLTRMLLAVSLVCATVSTVQAQSAEPPTFAVGDTWKRSQGIEITVVKSDNDGSVRKGFIATCPECLSHFNKENNLVDVTDASGKPVDVTSLPNVLVGSRWKLFQWPLQVGKSWSFSADGAFSPDYS